MASQDCDGKIVRHAACGVLGALLLGAAVPSASAQQTPPSAEEMWAIIQQQQQEIEALRAKLEETDQKVEATGAVADEMMSMRAEGGGGGGGSFLDRTSLGGYGELHYEGGDTDEVDFHRFVLFIGHEFNDRLRLFTEFELEHALAGEGQPGEVELEQAWIEFDVTDTQHARAGLFLLPVGIMNETHEPPTFFGVERNQVESAIIPTTWWEAGVGMSGQIGGGFSYDAAFHSGLSVPITGGNAFVIRSGRQKVAEAPAEDFAATGRLRWTGMPGVELATSLQYQQDVTQDALDVSGTLFEAHANIRRGPWGFRALYARWDLEDGPPILGPAALGRDQQYGWYVEPSYRFDVPGLGGPGEFGLFARYSEVDTQAGDAVDSEVEQWHFGFNYWPHPDVVLKADYQIEDRPNPANEDDRINLGLGYQF